MPAYNVWEILKIWIPNETDAASWSLKKHKNKKNKIVKIKIIIKYMCTNIYR